MAISDQDALAWVEAIPSFLHHPGQVLFYRGHFPYGVYLLQWGTLRMTPNSFGAGPGECLSGAFVLGLDHALSQKAYPLTAVVTVQSAISFLPNSLFKKWIEDKNPLLKRFMRVD